MNEIKDEVANAAAWLLHQVAELQYGQVGVTLVLHGGRISRIETCMTQKLLPGKGPQDDRNEQ